MRPQISPTPWSAETEMTGYLREEVIDGDNHTLAWKANENTFLSRQITQKYQCIPATSMESKRVLSMDCDIVMPIPMLLGPDVLVFLSKMMLLREKNLKLPQAAMWTFSRLLAKFISVKFSKSVFVSCS